MSDTCSYTIINVQKGSFISYTKKTQFVNEKKLELMSHFLSSCTKVQLANLSLQKIKHLIIYKFKQN